MIFPRFLYRLDERSPNEIFRDGFKSWGGDEDIVRHLEGESTRNKASAYIATSESKQYLTGRFAYIYGRAQTKAKEQAPNDIYVYTIANRSNFTCVNSIRNSLDLPTRINGYLDNQKEWIALHQIPPQDILHVLVLQFNEGSYKMGSVIPNKKYNIQAVVSDGFRRSFVDLRFREDRYISNSKKTVQTETIGGIRRHSVSF